MNAEYNPLAPFSKGEFLKSPLIKGDLGGCHTHARELLQINKTQYILYKFSHHSVCNKQSFFREFQYFILITN